MTGYWPKTASVNKNLDEDYDSYIEIKDESNPLVSTDMEDELTQKLKKLKILFEKQLISQEEYERKKADILSQL